ncbi:MAG: hypothetical protein MUE44_25510 [Oscillatoriaceae cyanobacterium Prado104]|jgi:hypothetical protein|nr:hypothetical protein [Oscillatoriaceae cyanobacterium Prado104]
MPAEPQNQPTPEQPQSQTASSDVPAPPTAAKPAAKPAPAGDGQSLLQKVGLLWQSIVGLVRSILPASVTQKLPDPILQAAIAAVLIVAVSFTLNLFSGKPTEKIAAAPVPEVSKAPETFTDFAAPETAQAPETFTDFAAPETAQAPETFTDFAAPKTPEVPDAIAPAEPESTKFKSKLPDLVAPEAPEIVEIVQPPPLTPEQSLIAAIQNQVADITNRLGGGLVRSVQANFYSSILTVSIAEDWYKLSEAEQDRLANQMWQEANSLDFSKLEIANLEGQLIARSPVVGSEMVVLERRKN